MGECTAVNEIRDVGQLGAVEGVLGRVDYRLMYHGGSQAASSQPGSSLL